MTRLLPFHSTTVPLLTAAFLFLFIGSSKAEPTVPGFKVTVYAVVADPVQLAFDQSNVLYAGRDDSGSGGGSGDPVKIHRIGVGGSSVAEFGTTAIHDPDAVLVDTSGTYGPSGSILVGGGFDSSQGQIVLVEPDHSIITLFGPTTDFWNPTGFALDSNNRLFFTNFDSRPSGTVPGVYSTDSPTTPPSILIATGVPAAGIATDSQDRLYVSTADARIRLYQNDGALIDDRFVEGLGGSAFAAALVIGSLGDIAEALYTINSDGELLCVTTSGQTTVIGTGFSSVRGLAIDSEGALYVSEFSNDRVLRCERITEPSITIRGRATDDSLDLTFEGIVQSSDTLAPGSWTDLNPQPATPVIFTPSPSETNLFWRARTWNGCPP